MLNSLSTFLKTRWVLLAELVIFIILKIPHLSYPFYCDEGWVYAPAVKIMAANGPSLMPTAIPSDYSRGHPLLFHFLCGLWIKLFGTSNVAVHSFPLLISVLFLVSLYEGCRRLLGDRIAILALLLVSTQIIFFVQASFVEPEVMVALLTFLSLYYYATDRLLLTSLMLSMLFFTKESGVVFGAAIGLHAFVSLFISQDDIWQRILRVVAIVVPAVLIGLFFILQKSLLGWYLLPLHSGLIHTDWDSVYKLFRSCLNWTFQGDPATYIIAFLVMILALVPAIKHKNARYLFLCLPAIIVYILTDKDITDKTGDVIWVVLFILFFIAPFYYLFRIDKTLNQPTRKFIVLLGLCFGAYLCFSSLSVLTYRYLLPEIVLLLIFLAVCIEAFIKSSTKKLYYAAIAGIVLTGIFAIFTDRGKDDTDLEAFHAMNVQKSVAAYLEKENAYDKEVAGGSFWELVHLIDTTQGFLSSGRIFSKINWETVRPETSYAFFDNICYNKDYDRIRNDSSFRLVYKATDGTCWAEIYKRN